MSLLEVRGLHVWFDVPGHGRLHAVRGLELGLEPRERLGLVGESGCGKSTALLAIMGLLPSNANLAGEVLLDGENILATGDNSARAHRWKDIAMVFQGNMNAFNPVKTIGAQITEPMAFHRTASGPVASTRAATLLEMVGLDASAARRYPHELSGGMRQRAALAMALACEPRVLLADEPTTALDVVVQAQLLDLLVQLADDNGLGLVLVTHDLPVVAQVCHRAATMYAGEVVEAGPVDVMYRAPAHPYTASLFAATLALAGQRAAIPGTAPRLDATPEGCSFELRGDRSMPACGQAGRGLREVADDHLAACHLNDLPSTDEGVPGSLAGRPDGHGHGSPVEAPSLPGEGQRRRDPVLQIDDLVVEYPAPGTPAGRKRSGAGRCVRAVDGLSLSVAPGEMVALVGQSGCGKTTTALAALRLVDPVSGSVLLEGREITGLSQRKLRPLRQRMQMVYQDPYESLDPRFRVRDTLAEPLLVSGERPTPAERDRRVREALQSVDLGPPDLYLERYPHELSGGQRQRLAIATALVVRPRLLVADEPVSMLDVSVRAGIVSLLVKLLETNEMGVLMITHDLSTAARFATRIAVMSEGRIVEEGDARQLISRPRHPYTRTLLASVPKPLGPRV